MWGINLLRIVAYVGLPMLFVAFTCNYAFSYRWVSVNNDADCLVFYDDESAVSVSEGIVLAISRSNLNIPINEMETASGVTQNTQLFDCVNKKTLTLEFCIGGNNSDFLECKSHKNSEWKPVSEALHEDLIAIRDQCTVSFNNVLKKYTVSVYFTHRIRWGRA